MLKRSHFLAGLFLAVSLAAAAAPAQVRVVVLAAGESADSDVRLPQDAMHDTHVSRGRNDIELAWLVQPTTRFSHGVLGDRVEAAGVSVRARGGAVLTYVLPEDAVFEDLFARVHDVDGDGRDEVLVVRSTAKEGASLMALGVRDGKLVPLAQTPPAGPGVWLNPVGVADVTGDGRLEVIVVVAPHGDGILIQYRFEAGRFIELHRISGFSNHVIGSRELGLSAFMDVDDDKMLELVLPTRNRRALRVIQLHDGTLFESSRLNLPSAAAGEFEVRSPSSLIVPLEDGRRALIHWR